jgi:hypothetical protein
MADNFNIGAAFFCVNNGDPTDTADWVVTFAQDVEINTQNAAAFRQGAFVPSQLMQGVSLLSRPSMTVQLIDTQLPLLKEFFVGGAVTSSGGFDAVSFPDTAQFLTAASFPYVAVIPLAEATGTNDEDAEHGFWLPNGYITGPSGLGYTRPEDGSDPARRYSISVMGVIDESLAATFRAGFWGDPAAFSLTWVLPSLNTAALG